MTSLPGEPLEFQSVAEALRSLTKLEAEIQAAATFAALDAIARKAAAIQRFAPIKEVGDRAGEVWVEADRKLGEELATIGKAKGTRGQFRGSTDGSGGAIIAPPEQPALTLADLGLPGDAGKKRAARAAKLAVIHEDRLAEIFETLTVAGRGITPNAVLVEERKEAKREKLYRLLTAAFSDEGPFDVVVIDPPWPMQKIDRDERLNQDAFDYPTMTVEEIEAFWRAEVVPRLNEDCHTFWWTTQKYLPAAFDLIRRLDLRYVLTMVWRKAGGFQPIGLPQYNCEFVVYARRGAPVFIDTKDFDCCFDGERREHSRKPDSFYDTIRRVTGGSRIDVFSREAREGFAQYGNESAKFAGAA